VEVAAVDVIFDLKFEKIFQKINVEVAHFCDKNEQFRR